MGAGRALHRGDEGQLYRTIGCPALRSFLVRGEHQEGAERRTWEAAPKHVTKTGGESLGSCERGTIRVNLSPEGSDGIR